MRQTPLEPAEAGFVVQSSLRCSSCGLHFVRGDLLDGKCLGCSRVMPQITKLCRMGDCEEPVLSNHHWYCKQHREEMLDKRLRRPGSRPKSPSVAAELRERHRVRTVEKRRYDQVVYNPAYRKVRKAYAATVDAGLVDCWRCKTRILAGEPWHLGHVDGDPTRIAGPEHVRCNCATAKRDRRRSS
jgi:hypothetical protein